MEPDKPKFQSECELIVGCSQVTIPIDAATKLTELLAAPLDWDYILSVARRNAVLPLLCWNLLNHFPHLLADDTKRHLKTEFDNRSQRNMYMTYRLLELVRFFHENNIPAIPFKGPTLAVQAYGNPALRHYGDLDILVRPADFEKAFDLLRSSGYEPVTNVNLLNKRNWYISTKKDISFVDKERSLNLELHWKLSGSHFALPLEMERIWGSVDDLSVAGSKVNTLSFNDLVIYLCLHGSRHGWERLGWICDLNELIRSRQNIDWESLDREASRLGCENVLGLGLRLVREFFGLEKLAAGLERIISSAGFDGIVSDIRSRLFLGSALPMNLGDRYLYHLKLKERSLDRWKLHLHYNAWYLRIILKPNELDRNVIRLPSWMAPLYYLVRPVRLLYGSVLSRHARQKGLNSTSKASTIDV